MAINQLVTALFWLYYEVHHAAKVFVWVSCIWCVLTVKGLATVTMDMYERQFSTSELTKKAISSFECSEAVKKGDFLL